MRRLRTALAGNIGLPLLELVDEMRRPGRRTVQLPDPRRRRRARPHAIVNLFFRSTRTAPAAEARYIEDKLALVEPRRSRHAVLNAADPRPLSNCRTALKSAGTAAARGWHRARRTLQFRGDAW